MPTGLCLYTFSHLAGGYDAYGLMDLVARHGLSGVEFPPDVCLPDLNSDTLRKAKDYAADRGLFIVADGGLVEPEMLRRLIPVARELGASTLRVILSSVVGGDRRPMAGRWEEHMQSCLEILRETIPIAENYGVNIAIENHNDTTSLELLRLCEELDSAYIGINLDTGSVLAVCEEPVGFATRLMPFLKNIHLKDYTIHPTDEGFRIARCPLGKGVVDFPVLLPLIDRHHPGITRSMELGALDARHVRMLADDYWSEYPVRPVTDMLPFLRMYWRHIRPENEDWRTPKERGESDEVKAAYEIREFEESVAYLKTIGAV